MKVYRFNKDGELIPIDVYIVWGSPASGKTTYVKEHMEDGDLVIDLDLIKQSISYKDKTSAGDNLVSLAIGIRDYLYEQIRHRDIDCNTVWVVAGLPMKEDRDKLKDYIRATQMIHIDTDYDECIKRADKDVERKDKGKQYEVIDKWFEMYYKEQ